MHPRSFITHGRKTQLVYEPTDAKEGTASSSSKTNSFKNPSKNALFSIYLSNSLVAVNWVFSGQKWAFAEKMSRIRKNRPILWRLPSGLFSISLKCTFFVGGAGAGMMDRQSATKQLPSTSCERFRGTDRKYWPKILLSSSLSSSH